MKLLIDYETRSRADLKKTGQHGYAIHPSTELLCLGWKVIGEKDAHVISCPGIYLDDPSETKEFYYALKHAEQVVAHNAPFEQSIYNYVHAARTPMGKHLRKLTPQDWLCTLSMCSIMALPRALASANEALGLKVLKDTEGRKLLLKMCKPRPMKNDLSKWQEWVDDQPHLERLYEYCRQDLLAEEALYSAIKDYRPFTDKERKLWELDQKVNQRGFRIDSQLVLKVLELINLEETTLTKELNKKTFGWVKTAKQTANLKSFLADQGLKLPNVQKKTIDDALLELQKAPDKWTEVIDVLKIRQALGKSSTSKYQAFKDRMSPADGRVRDNLLYHGASTGRWSGSGVQPQNFPRGTIKVSEQDFKEVYTGDLEWLRMSYGRPMDLFSSMLRGVIQASPGFELFCADYSSIEARVLLWCAEDYKGLKEYDAGLDAYKSMASTIYGVDYEDVTPEQRQLGKQVVLACFNKSTRVLTQRGWVKITQIKKTDKLWDGTDWVLHEGVVCQGLKKTINLFGVKVTPDHKVLTPQGWRPAFQVQKENTLYLQSVTNLVNLPLNKLSKVKGAEWLQFKYLAHVAQNAAITYTLQTYLMVKAPVVTYAQKLLQLILTNFTLTMRPLCPTTSIDGDYLIEFVPFLQDATIKKVKDFTTTGAEALKFLSLGAEIEKLFYDTWSLLKVGTVRSLSLTGLTLTKATSPVIYALLLVKKMLTTAGQYLKCKLKLTNLELVYDVVNAGPLNRFTVMTSRGPMLVHNCGYQMGVKKFKLTAVQNGVNAPESLLQRAHEAFRIKYPKVPQVWANYELAAIKAVQTKKAITVNRVTWFVDKDFLCAKLPSGRRLFYYKPRVQNEETPWGDLRPKLYHWGVDSLSKKWVESATYGGKLTENIVQAISRDCMAEAMPRVENAGFRVLITVHDEVLTEAKLGTQNLETFKKLMSERPEWGSDIPLSVSGYQSLRYRK